MPPLLSLPLDVVLFSVVGALGQWGAAIWPSIRRADWPGKKKTVFESG